MSQFDFITDEDFRASLEKDYKEMQSCLKAGAWKAVHVLVGSIIESILIDYLISGGFVTKQNALKMDLGEVIVICKEKNIITTKINDLATVIKGYRNLIHPGRLIRLKENISPDSAQVAKSLLNMVLEEISAQKRENYGYTAEQIISKIERDSSFGPIIPHILKDTNTLEIERLLLYILPSHYLKTFEEEYTPPHVRPTFVQCFRHAFSLASDNLKKQVTKNFVTILKEESEGFVFSYESAFLRCEDLAYLSENDKLLVKKHILSRLKEDTDGELLETLSGVGAFVSKSEVSDIVDYLVRLIIFHNDIDVETKAKETLKFEHVGMPSEIDQKVISRIEDWIHRLLAISSG